MDRHPTKKLVIALLVAFPAAGAIAQSAHRPPRPGGTSMQRARPMGKNMEAMQAGEAKLDRLVRAMNAAKGAKKADAIAAAVTEMVAQHKQMCAVCMDMMAHERMGGPREGRRSPGKADHARHH